MIEIISGLMICIGLVLFTSYLILSVLKIIKDDKEKHNDN